MVLTLFIKKKSQKNVKFLFVFDSGVDRFFIKFLIFSGIPCQCPFLANPHYVTPQGGLNVQTKNPHLSWLTDGDFYIKAVLTSTSGENACVEVYFSLSSS